MKRQKSPQLVLLLALAAVAILVAIFFFLQDWDEGESQLDSEPDLRSSTHERVEIRRSSSQSSWASRYESKDESEWEPFDESDEDRQKVPVWVRGHILETGKALVSAEVSIYVHDKTRDRLFLIHGRREDNGEFFFRMPQDFEVVGARARHNLNHDHEAAFIPESIFQKPEARAEGFQLDLRLSQAPAISGHVIDVQSGRMIADAEISVKSGSPRWQTRTNDRGEFALYALNVHPGMIIDWLQLEVKAKGYVTRECAVDLQEHPSLISGLEIGMQQAYRLGGFVRDESGRAVPDAEVTLMSEERPSRAPIRPLDFAQQTTSDAAGRFVFTGIPALASGELRVEARGLLPLREKISAIDSDRGGLELRMKAGRHLGLEPTFPDGSSPDGALVRVFATDENGDWHTINLNPLAERREIRVSATKPTRVSVFVMKTEPNRGSVWWRCQVRYDPDSNLDSLVLPLEVFPDTRDPFLDHGLQYSCVWGVFLQTNFLDYQGRDSFRIHFDDGTTRFTSNDAGVRTLSAPGSLLAFGLMGSPLQHYYVAAEPGSKLKIEYRRPEVPALNHK